LGGGWDHQSVVPERQALQDCMAYANGTLAGGSCSTIHSTATMGQLAVENAVLLSGHQFSEFKVYLT